MDPSVISPYPSLDALGSSSGATGASETEGSRPASFAAPRPSRFCGVGGDVDAAPVDARRARGPSTSQSEVSPQFRNVFLSTYRYTPWRCDDRSAFRGVSRSAAAGNESGRTSGGAWRASGSPPGPRFAARAGELLKLGFTSFISFGPLIAVFSVLFVGTYLLMGSDFIHGGDQLASRPPPYVPPEALLAEPTVDRMVPFDGDPAPYGR